MARYRKKPVVVEAIVWRGRLDDFGPWMEELGGLPFWLTDLPRLVIDTLEGQMTAQPGDYIIRGVADEFYPCKPDIFEQTYERMEE